VRKNAVRLSIPAVKPHAFLLAVAIILAGCGSQGGSAVHITPKANPSETPNASSPTPAASASPTASLTPSPVPLSGSFAVLATTLSGDTYTVSIVAINGKVVATATPSSPTAVTCGDAAGAVVPIPVSTSDDRAYYMDAQGVVRFMTVQGDTGRATTVPTGGGRRSMFSVSPDDQRIAVVVSDYTSSGVAVRLYVEDLNGGANHVDIFSSSGPYGLWPIGWIGTSSLVVAKVPACTQGGGPLSAGPLELHVVDPATAARKFTIGGPSCVIAGSASPAGAVCESTNSAQASVVDWTAVTKRTFAIKQPTPAYLSPDGAVVALASNSGTTFQGSSRTLNMLACGWIDSAHVISGGDIQQQPRIGNVTNGSVIPVAAQGTCAGRLPGGL
jgi:hypothetical protein